MAGTKNASDPFGEQPLEPGDNERGHHAAGQADDEPREPVPCSSLGCYLERIADARGLALDPGEPVDVLHVLTSEDVEQRRCRHHAEQRVVVADDRHRGEAMTDGEQGDLLLVAIREDLHRRVGHEIAKRAVRRRGEERAERHDALQPPRFAHHVDGVHGIVDVAGESRDGVGHGRVASRGRHPPDDVRAGGFGSRVVRRGCDERLGTRSGTTDLRRSWITLERPTALVHQLLTGPAR